MMERRDFLSALVAVLPASWLPVTREPETVEADCDCCDVHCLPDHFEIEIARCRMTYRAIVPERCVVPIARELTWKHDGNGLVDVRATRRDDDRFDLVASSETCSPKRMVFFDPETGEELGNYLHPTCNPWEVLRLWHVGECSELKFEIEALPPEVVRLEA